MVPVAGVGGERLGEGAGFSPVCTWKDLRATPFLALTGQGDKGWCLLEAPWL